jgi:hypothetical protein
MEYEEIIHLLGYAGDHDQPVRITVSGDAKSRRADQRGHPRGGPRSVRAPAWRG